MLESGVKEGALVLKSISVDDVIRSQGAGFRQRRQGLQYRLYLSQKKGVWRPRKRFAAKRKSMPLFYRLIQRLRIKIKDVSKAAFIHQQKHLGLNLFKRRVAPWLMLYKGLYGLRSIAGRIKKKC